MTSLTKINLASIKAIGHDGTHLQIMLEAETGYTIESLPAPRQAFEGIQQLANFTALLNSTGNGQRAREILLDEIQMLPVESSTIVAIGYCDVCRVLQVDFVNGSRYRYQDVPTQVFTQFKAAESKGRFLNSVIKRKYAFPYEQVN